MDCTFIERRWIEIPLRNRQKEVIAYAMVSLEDAHLATMRWSPSGHGYPQTRCRLSKRVKLMHRFILAPSEGLVTDHINRNRLDNRRENLRAVTQAQNSRNQGSRRPGQYKGVHFGHGAWVAQIVLNGKNTYLGRFKTPEEAARAYDQAARNFHGEFAFQNFVV